MSNFRDVRRPKSAVKVKHFNVISSLSLNEEEGSLDSIKQQASISAYAWSEVEVGVTWKEIMLQQWMVVVGGESVGEGSRGSW
ncbi:WD repeat-containing protein 69 [Sesbania bispinosa]|nr:WD repeat-containing protein 69 [Sesbania bispinosa]